MPKIFSFLSVLIITSLLTITLSIFAPIAYGMDSCESKKITFDPRTFYTGQDFKMTFIINPIVLDNLKNNNNIKRIKVSLKRTFNTAWEVELPIAQQFSITINDPELQQEANTSYPHTGNLYMSSQDSGNSWQDLCGEISYTVKKTGGTCQITNMPSAAPPGSKIDIQFSGDPNTVYKLRYINPNLSLYANVVDENNNAITTTTNGSGIGSFLGVKIPGNDRETATVMISAPSDTHSCSAPITFSLTVSQPTGNGGVLRAPQPPGSGTTGTTPTTPGAAISAGGDKCTSGFTDEKNNQVPAINTAIGCIPTEPVALIKALLRFVLGIGGGIAFLIMIGGAFQMITSAGNPDSLKNGSDMLTNAIIGILFIIFSLLFFQVIGLGILNLPGFII